MQQQRLVLVKRKTAAGKSYLKGPWLKRCAALAGAGRQVRTASQSLRARQRRRTLLAQKAFAATVYLQYGWYATLRQRCAGFTARLSQKGFYGGGLRPLRRFQASALAAFCQVAAAAGSVSRQFWQAAFRRCQQAVRRNY
ncbi:hypothetical protein NPIL_3301 [Nephila pilipes]|uniref:Uncharacterized protein n=1 Tax=Nephila pilipes TaxID=299642 RepID=A0A8X6TYY2_NEPPI|nr:hypothetical protein NPIL_3301 [Nephila pilipes]